MSNRAKLLVSVLFIAVIILCVGLTRFYFDVTKNTGNTGGEDEVRSIVRTYGDMQVFESTNGYYGLMNSEDAVVIEPEWMEILDVTPELVLVSTRIQDSILIGGIDYEENVVLPFVFRSMEAAGEHCLIGVVEADESCMIYQRNYQPAFRKSYDAAKYDDGILTLDTENCRFSYDVTKEQPELDSAEMVCAVGELTLQWQPSKYRLLPELEEDDLLRINNCVELYMEMLLTSDFTALPEITSSDSVGKLTRPGSFSGMELDTVSDLSFDKEEDIGYDLAFTLGYHMTEAEQSAQTVQVHLYFQRNADNILILSSADLDFQSQTVAEPETTDAE